MKSVESHGSWSLLFMMNEGDDGLILCEGHS